MEETEKSKEFGRFLESIGGLKSGYFSDKSPITSRYFFSIGDGWLDLTRDLIENLIKIGWDKKILQVKEKFGGARFYAGPCTEEQDKLIEEYENKSFEVCEQCGEKGEVRDLPWIMTLCENHYKEKLKN
jgi:hypothetical protein